ncbi:hypothetical protein AX16_006800 [Volvariella volvacea WC 439]|nr:hypothetical protein AX16_006800 [Volvariella volvacea WC 439]
MSQTATMTAPSATVNAPKGAPYALLTIPHIPDDLKADHRETFYYEMSQIHNTFIRGVNSIWEKAPLVLPKDEVAFAGYCLAMTLTIHDHHRGEEEIIFPFLSKYLSMEHNVEQHEAFQGFLDAFEGYMKGVQSKKEKYNAERVRELLVALADPLVQHLHDEIPTITPESLKKFEKVDVDAMIARHEEHIKAMSLPKAFCWVFSHTDQANYPNWPPIPGFLRWVVRNVASRRHSSYWKFSPIDFAGKPQQYIGNAVTAA